jgi:hypothetical protein
MKPIHSEVKRPRRVKNRSMPEPEPSNLTPDEHAYIEAGRAALALPHKTFEVWLVVGKAIQLLRVKADRIGTGKAFARLLGQHGFGKLDRATCTRLLWIMENIGEVTAWHAGLPPKKQMEWAAPSTVRLHCPKTEDLAPVKSLTALEAFEVLEKMPPQEFLAAYKSDDLLRRVPNWLNGLARASEGRPATSAREKFGSAEGGSRLHSTAAGGAGGGTASADAPPAATEARACDASGGMAPVGNHDAGGTKPPAFTPDDIEQLQTIIKPVRERLLLEFTMEKWADLAREDRREFVALIRNMKRGRKRPKDEVGRFAALLLAAIFEEYTGKLPGRSSRGRETTDTKLRDKNSPFYRFRRAACDAIGIDVSDAALKAAIAELKGRGKLEANFLELRKLLWGKLQMADDDLEQVRIHFSMARDAVAEGGLLSDVLSPGPPVQITVGSALIDAFVHLREPLEDMRKDKLAEFVLRVLRSRR